MTDGLVLPMITSLIIFLQTSAHLVSLHLLFVRVKLGRGVAAVVMDQLLQDGESLLYIILQRVNLGGDGCQDLKLENYSKISCYFYCEIAPGFSQQFYEIKDF